MNTNTRYLALDVMRGMTVALMIMVNNPGSWQHVYPPLLHAQWHGCTPTDLVFPFFLFAVGVSMFFSFAKYGDGLTRSALWKIGKRTLLIFAIGLFLNTFPQWTTDWSHIRWMGVLQRIALAYGVAAVLVLAIPRKVLPAVSSLILLAYWAVLYFGGGNTPYTLADNVVLQVDLLLFAPQNLYGGFGIPFDPEGVLSTVPAVVTVLMGYGAAYLIRTIPREKIVVRLALWGLGGIALGYLWDLVLPINKALWTSSYAVFTGGWAALFLAALIGLIDVKGYQKWTGFFVVFGMNPLFIYALAGMWSSWINGVWMVTMTNGTVVGAQSWFYSQILVPLAGYYNGSLLFAILNVVCLWFLGWILYRRKIFIKV